MSNYLFSRFIIVCLVRFFTSWAFNAKNQLLQFFIPSFFQENLLMILGWILSAVIIALGIVSINIIFTFLRYSDESSIDEIFEHIKKNGIIRLVKRFFQYFSNTLNNNFNYELNREKYPNLIFFLLLIYFPFVKGNPIINNYYGVYKKYTYEDIGSHGETTSYREIKHFIFPKTEKEEINNTIKDLETEVDDEDWDFIVKKRGYIFLQAGLLDGYRDDYSDYRGFGGYIECIAFSFIEKTINTLMYFLLPYIILISIYHYRKSNSKINVLEP